MGGIWSAPILYFASLSWMMLLDFFDNFWSFAEGQPHLDLVLFQWGSRFTNFKRVCLKMEISPPSHGQNGKHGGIWGYPIFRRTWSVEYSGIIRFSHDKMTWHWFEDHVAMCCVRPVGVEVRSARKRLHCGYKAQTHYTYTYIYIHTLYVYIYINIYLLLYCMYVCIYI